MAATDTGERLTEAHRLAQGRITADALRDVLALWRLLDPTALDRSFPAYARAVTVVLAARRDTSTATSAAYLRAFREAERITGPFDVALAAELERERVMTTLLVTGPVTIKRATAAGKPAEEAARSGLVSTLGAAARLVQSGGRDTVAATVARDEAALGVARVSDGHPCAFCAMLVSRGPVFKSAGTADFHAHDKCGCQAEPVYHTDGYRWPGGARAQKLADLWRTSTDGLSTAEARNAFRRAYERPTTA